MSNKLTTPLTKHDRLLLEIKHGQNYIVKITNAGFNDKEPWETQAERRANHEWLLQMAGIAKKDNAK